MTLWKRYLRPSTVEGALTNLAQAEGPARVVAGGTDLLIDMQQGRHPAVDTLVDITQIPELGLIRLQGDQILLGAAVVHQAIVGSPLLGAQAECLVEACGLIGGPQVRNVATIGGNVAHALPAADGTIALLALGAEAQIAGPEGRRWEPLEALFSAPGLPAFDRGREVLVSFRFPAPESDQATAFRRVMRPQGVAIAILNMAVWMKVGPDDSIGDVRLSVGPAGPRPLRAVEAEEALRGTVPHERSLDRAVEALLAEAQLRTSRHRATKSYRERLIRVLLNRTLEACYRRALDRKAIVAAQGHDPTRQGAMRGR